MYQASRSLRLEVSRRRGMLKAFIAVGVAVVLWSSVLTALGFGGAAWLRRRL